VMNKNYNGESEACLGCKKFYRDTDDKAPCDVCLYRIHHTILVDGIDRCKGEPILGGEWGAYRRRGCASHANTTDRDKVLDMENRIKAIAFLDVCWDEPILLLNDVIAELRQEVTK